VGSGLGRDRAALPLPALNRIVGTADLLAFANGHDVCVRNVRRHDRHLFPLELVDEALDASGFRHAGDGRTDETARVAGAAK
jgi:hypothetical protein